MYNQPSSQSPAMFGSQSGGAQMQSAPNLPPGNAPGREYFNHSMATFTNAMQPPTGMVPQGISSLVPGYFFGGDVASAAADAAADSISYDASVPGMFGGISPGLGGDADTSGNVAIDFGSVSAAMDAAQAQVDAEAAAAAASAVENDIGFNQADANQSAELANVLSVLSDYNNSVALVQDSAVEGGVPPTLADTMSSVGALGTGGIEGYDALAASIAEDQDQAALGGSNDASRGAATLGLPPP